MAGMGTTTTNPPESAGVGNIPEDWEPWRLEVAIGSANGVPVRQLAAKVGKDRCWLGKWIAQPETQSVIRALRREAIANGYAAFTSLLPDIHRLYADTINNDEIHIDSRIRAAMAAEKAIANGASADLAAAYRDLVRTLKQRKSQR